MNKSNLPEPEFEEGFYFRVVLRGPNGKLILPQNPTAEDFEEFNLNDRQIDALLKMKNEVNNLPTDLMQINMVFLNLLQNVI